MSKSSYRCLNAECAAVFPMFRVGKCPQCGSFEGFKEQATASSSGAPATKAGLKSAGAVTPTKRAYTIDQLNANPMSRIPSGIGELDRVLGGGFVKGQVVLFSAAPGSGKSTLSLSIAEKFAEKGKTVLYSSGEESEQQIGLRAKRMGVSNPNIRIVHETNLETLFGHIEQQKPELLVVDSIQTIASTEISGVSGSTAQSKEAAHALTRLAKEKGIMMVLISQVVKSGDFAGSESIQHIVDTTMMLESSSESPLKFLRPVKNRFGDTSEVGVFQHSETGLEEVSDPSGVLLYSDMEALPGTALSFISEGMRQIPVEVQALVTESSLANPRKQFNGVNPSRAQIVCAILDKFCKARLFENDTFVSTVSGVKVSDVMADLAMAAAILSSIHGRTFGGTTAFVGELSLTGQVRGSFMMDGKVREAQRLGFDRVVIPKSSYPSVGKGHSIKVDTISSIEELPKKLTGR